MLERSQYALHKFYEMFASGLTTAEIERLIKVDMRGMYEFYARHMPRPATPQKPLRRLLQFTRNLFLAFLLKLTPARRLLYALSLLFVILAFWYRELSWLFNAFLVMNFLLALELADKLVAKDELAVAREIQLRLLPCNLLQRDGFTVVGFSDAALSVGGDYYDFITTPGSGCLVIIGDVSGKGIPAALYTAKVQTLLQIFARESQDPRTLLLRVNEHLLRELKRSYFLTLAIVRLLPHGGLQFCRAGHTPALHFDSRRRDCFWLKPDGLAIGLAAERRTAATGEPQSSIFRDHLQLVQTALAPGDVLLLYTDGVSETCDPDGREFGDERLRQVLLRHPHVPAETIKDALLHELTQFRRGADMRDDTTFVIIKRDA
ncbi:MAG: serine/threonine-protein phosphatase [candidate division KSB1 bacterium]|nr:serine/threonine-protein phosphatase [candidate division KSB1 bacterium]MDZ7273188.1 serine/threonine-protein phosphatase [candidate division KSB1 bacterium]MDZ7285290.1 serine/threonine-protein phosphatase [candidate division KSB1 bacterium]MDZ7298322.1 serine/threonine-protein phosphatase [candidate division KSB1 bacterium]MDZ7307397.1 serine/threonine-protein phosphatase [candidate division KSB1 bacterium]